MSNPVLAALKTGRQLAATAGLVLGIFGMPALMAGGVVLPSLVAPEAVEWMGTGDDDPTVTLSADLLAELNGNGTADKDAPPPKKGSDVPAEPASAEGGPDKVADNAIAVPTTRRTAASKKAPARSGPVSKAVDRHKAVKANRGSVDGSIGGRSQSRAKKAAIAARARGKRCKAPIDGVSHLFGDRYTVERDVLERYDSMEAAVGLARVAWNKDSNGKTDGFKLYRVACGSPLTQVGLRTGDVIHKINGKRVRTLPGAFSAIRKVKRHDAIHLEFSRGGKPMTRVVTII